MTKAQRAANKRDIVEPGDEGFMCEALALADAVLGLTTPNPAVGCVIVRDGVIVGRGVTAAGGRPHGETQALADAGEIGARSDGLCLA